MDAERSPWYRDGLRFTCHGCGQCCRGSQPGWVYVSRAQSARIARLLGMELAEFEGRYVTEDESGEAVLRLRPSGDCIFWNDGCTVYDARPRQCRTFPFWPETLASPEEWESLKTSCGGVGQGRLYRIDEIGAVLRGRATG